MSGSRDWVGMLGMPAAAGGIAVCFSHPLELTKVRLQLDNERAAAGTPRVYKGWLDCVGQNFKKDGVRGLQRGLSLGITREVCFNAVRIGLLEPVLEGVHAAAVTIGWASQEASPGSSERLAAGLTCGALGGMCVNPIEVLKTRFQAFGGLTGFQHQSAAANPVSALLDLFRTEGLSGAFRGVATSTLRGMLGPGSQIYAYGEIKSWAVSRGASANSSATHVACALASASVSVLCVNPVDVTRTRCVSRTPTRALCPPLLPSPQSLVRHAVKAPQAAKERVLESHSGSLYNAPAGRYAGGVDAAMALVQTEGPLAFYKGSLTHFLRLGPHMVLVFGILEQMKLMRGAR
jgi:solute carrier family 25 protein 34/35